MPNELTLQRRLAQIVAEETDGGRTVVRFFVKVAQGELDREGFKAHHRIAAGRELLKRGFDYECAHAQTSDDATPEDRPDASEREVGESEYPEHPIHPENPGSDEEPIDYVAMAKEIAENLDPSEL